MCGGRSQCWGQPGGWVDALNTAGYQAAFGLRGRSGGGGPRVKAGRPQSAQSRPVTHVGAAHRLGPTGGSAYGTPRNARASL